MCYRGRDGALRRRRRVQRRNELDCTPPIPRLNGAGAAQRAVRTTRCSEMLNRYPADSRRYAEGLGCGGRISGFGGQVGVDLDGYNPSFYWSSARLYRISDLSDASAPQGHGSSRSVLNVEVPEVDLDFQTLIRKKKAREQSELS
jgi:hypothetical protein